MRAYSGRSRQRIDQFPYTLQGTGPRWMLRICTTLLGAFQFLNLQAQPLEIAGITRQQQDGPELSQAERLRVWIIGVGQGDAMLIELPGAVSEALGNTAGDPVNILIDGGATPVPLAKRTPQFLHDLYGANVTIEHMILTHHDRDHVVGLTQVLKDKNIAVRHVYASGLAAFKRGVRGIPTNTLAGGFIGDSTRSVGRFKANGDLEDKYLVATLAVLKQREADGELISDYGAFAKAIISKTQPQKVESFRQACFGCDALDSINAPAPGSRPLFKLTTVWPASKPHRYVDWGKTTNGNSVAFRLDYGRFSMLFTGDLNEESEPDLLRQLRQANKSDLLDVDILKAAHHGSRHNAKEFLEQSRLKPIVSVASMGEYGFSTSNYKHPDEGIMTTLGGPERFYSTFIHERSFKRADMHASDFEDMVEDTHVLIESDGARFRIVEVVRRHEALAEPTPVTGVESGNGTFWISAE